MLNLNAPLTSGLGPICKRKLGLLVCLVRGSGFAEINLRGGVAEIVWHVVIKYRFS